MIRTENFKRISWLGERIKANQASKAEKDEYMLLMRNQSLITQKQYDDYLKNESGIIRDELVEAALVIGAIALLIYLFSDSK